MRAIYTRRRFTPRAVPRLFWVVVCVARARVRARMLARTTDTGIPQNLLNRLVGVDAVAGAGDK